MVNHKVLFFVFLLVCFFTFTIEAQSYRVIKPGERKSSYSSQLKKQGTGNVSISVELLIEERTVGLAAQEWAKTFSKLGASCRVRQPLLDDKPEIKETKRGKLRMVTLIGLLDRRGTIRFPGKTFTQRDTKKLAEWIREIKAYGSQGAPTGQPVWGLSKKQFDPLFKALSQKVKDDLFAMPISKAIKILELPADYPIRVSAQSQKKLIRILEKDPLVRQSVKGFSKGTALAIILNDYTLGFRPLRTPEGNIELTLVAQADQSDVWPVGWETKTPFTKVARKLYQLIPIELKNVKLLDLLHAISVKTEIPVMVDYYHIEEKGIDIEKVVVSYPSKQASWSRLLKAVTVPNKMTRKYRIDESGKPFVWITTRTLLRKKK